MTTPRIASSSTFTEGTSAPGTDTSGIRRASTSPGLHEDQDCRAEQHDPQRREDAADHGQHHLQRRLGTSLLRALAALAPHLVGLDPQDLADSGAELLGLDDRLDKVVQVVDAAVASHLIQRLKTRAAEAHLAQRLRDQL